MRSFNLIGRSDNGVFELANEMKDMCWVTVHELRLAGLLISVLFQRIKSCV